jgi:hypothetical protein
MPPTVTTPAATLATMPAATLATPAAPPLVWMSPGDWHKVVTSRELKAEQKVERPGEKRTVAAQQELDEEVAVAREEEKPEPAEPAVSWIGSDPFGRPCVKRYLTAERAAAAGVNVERYFGADGDTLEYYSVRVSNRLSHAVRRAERAAADDEQQTQRAKAEEARRKRVRRIQEGKEDRDAMRELARSRACDALPLEPTPADVRRTALQGTPRSAKEAGAQLAHAGGSNSLGMLAHCSVLRSISRPRSASLRSRSLSGWSTRVSTASHMRSLKLCASRPRSGTLQSQVGRAGSKPVGHSRDSRASPPSSTDRRFR